jgi:hypothetical protein
MLTPYCVANPLTAVRVPRLFSGSNMGMHSVELLVRAGDSVAPTQVVAQAIKPPDFRIVEVAQELDIPAKNTAAHLKVERGQSIVEGEVLAARGRWSSRTCRSPITGRVVGIGRGRLLLEADPEILRLNALVPGYVIEARAGEGVVVETIGGWIEAAWGSGGEAYGPLRMVVRDRDHPLRVTHINASSEGTILVGGSTLDEECIAQAESMQVRGIVVGSVPPSLLARLREASLPIVATEGVGTLPMTQPIFELLHSVDGREAAVSSDMGDRWHPKRPCVIVPMPTRAARPINVNAPLAPGDRVRILRGAHKGRSGTLSRHVKQLVTLETDARLPGAEVLVGDEETLLIPYVNLERLL